MMKGLKLGINFNQIVLIDMKFDIANSNKSNPKTNFHTFATAASRYGFSGPLTASVVPINIALKVHSCKPTVSNPLRPSSEGSSRSFQPHSSASGDRLGLCFRSESFMMV